MKLTNQAIFVLACVARVSAGQALSVEARIYPEKQAYLVGEPVFLSLELANTGEQCMVVDSRFGAPCAMADTIEVVGARRRSFAWAPSCFGGTAGSCGSSGIELPPGKRHVERIFLSRLFLIENPGIYDVRARRNIPVYVYTNDFFSVKSVEASSDFQIRLSTAKEDELKTAFEPFVRDLTSPNSKVQSTAVDAITMMAPRFLENVILRLADTPRAAGIVMALGALNTRETKKKLAALAEYSDRDGVRQPAIGALAQTRDLAVLPVLNRIAKSGAQGDRDFALWNMGLFGEAAIPFLASTLSQKDLNMQIAAIRGLGASATRSAVPILIEVLRTSEHQTSVEARLSLAQLTHFSIDGNPYPQKPPRDEWRRWHDWWASHGATAKIFDTTDCSQSRPLP